MSESNGESTLAATDNVKKLGTTFHRTFWLSRPQVSQVLALAAEPQTDPNQSNCLTYDAIREYTHLGTVQVTAMSSYARSANLLNDGLCITEFGRAAQNNDPLLSKASTQWLMHYYISSPTSITAAFWHEIVRNRYRVGEEFTKQELVEDIREVVSQTEDRTIREGDADATARVFLGTYLERDALGSLGILEDLEDGRYLVLDPEPPSVWAFGIALLDYWRAQFGDRLTINLSDLLTSGGLADLFLIGSRRIDTYLSRLQEEGYVDVYRVAHPYQVVLLRQDPQPLLQKLYELADTV